MAHRHDISVSAIASALVTLASGDGDLGMESGCPAVEISSGPLVFRLPLPQGSGHESRHGTASTTGAYAR